MIEPGIYKDVMGSFPSGVTVVTTLDADGGIVGITASAFSALSIDPALVLFCPNYASDTYPILRDSKQFAIHLLSADQTAEAAVQKRDFSTRGYYGTLNHDMKATYQRYFGWWDGNPANFNPLPPEESAPKYVALAGGADKLLAAGRAAIAAESSPACGPLSHSTSTRAAAWRAFQ